tara:strand:- start:782 stop:1651 length:870 start_codon:yes stop_codon:yes gene_type:complete
MNNREIKEELNTKGYCIIKNVLNANEIFTCYELFMNWYESIDNFKEIHKKINPHNIFKFHQVGHQEFAWYLRTLPQIKNIFSELWNSNEMVVSFDGSCFIDKDNSNFNTKCWTHTDQAPKYKELKCYQGFVSLTNNKKNSLLVYEGSHKIHNDYFKSINNENDSKNWQLINKDYLDKIEDKKKILDVPAGSLVLWDSRTFHQNIHSDLEERLVQYICMLPKNNKLNNKSQKEKRLKYLNDLRTTSHWPYSIKVNSLQPRTYGNKSLLINYDNLEKPKLDKYMNKIKELI